MDEGFLSKVVQELAREVRKNTIALATLTADLANVSKDVAILSKLLTEGNGSAPLISRIAILENSNDCIEGAIENFTEELSSLRIKAKSSAKKLEIAIEDRKLAVEDNKDKRRSMVAIITSIVALLTTLVMSIFGISGS